MCCGERSSWATTRAPATTAHEVLLQTPLVYCNQRVRCAAVNALDEPQRERSMCRDERARGAAVSAPGVPRRARPMCCGEHAGGVQASPMCRGERARGAMASIPWCTTASAFGVPR